MKITGARSIVLYHVTLSDEQRLVLISKSIMNAHCRTNEHLLPMEVITQFADALGIVGDNAEQLNRALVNAPVMGSNEPSKDRSSPSIVLDWGGSHSEPDSLVLDEVAIALSDVKCACLNKTNCVHQMIRSLVKDSHATMKHD